MPLETGTYINSLVVTNPLNTDLISECDDHLRLIKSTLKNTFPDVSYGLAGSGGFVPTGGILMFTGAVAPTGWALCDGGTYSKVDGSGPIVAPDLRNEFIVGTGASYVLADTGGALSSTPAITVNNHTLTLAEMAVHNHGVSGSHLHGYTDPSHAHVYTRQNGSQIGVAVGGAVVAFTAGFSASTISAAFTGITLLPSTTGITLNNSGSGGAHAHTASSNSINTTPKYYALAYIVRL